MEKDKSEIKFLTTHINTKMILYKNYVYNFDRALSGRTSWRCANRTCLTGEYIFINAWTFYNITPYTFSDADIVRKKLF